MIDRSHYNIDLPAEDLTLYKPGGYHPIHISDRFKDGRYEILTKLGFGSFSTVWVARDHQDNCNVSIKVVVAKNSDRQNGELEILKHVKAHGDPNHLGRKHISQLLDWFYHDGPNGRHLCIVLELLGLKASTVANKCTNYRLGGDLARHISGQVLLAVDYLHLCGVAHGDIHMGNILFRDTKIDDLSPERIKELGAAHIGDVSRGDGAPLDNGMPNYLVEPMEYHELAQGSRGHVGEIQLVDFGESFFVESPPKSVCTPMSLHPPELVFGHSLSKAVDIWNFGSTIFELVTGRTPFEADFDDHALIPQFQKVLGGVPVEWVLDAINDGVLKERPKSFSAEGFLSLEEEIRRSYFDGYDPSTLQLDERYLGMLGHCLRKMLVVEPARRATTQELSKEAWFTNTALS